MSDWHPEIVVIKNIIHHPNADRLDIAMVFDYPVIVKRDEYKAGDIAAYIPIDSIVPDIEAYHFLSPKDYERYEENGEIKQKITGPRYQVGSVPEKYRIIKAKRILNVYSQGMLVPAPDGLKVGDSVVEVLNLKKWEEPEQEENFITPNMRGANAASPPKGWSIPYYDIEGIRKYLSCLNDGEEVIICEKLNGSNSSFVYDGEKLWVKSRNYYKKLDEEDMWWNLALRLDLEKKLAKYPMMVLFGECAGQVKGFKYDAEIVNGKLNTKLYCFDIYNLNTKKYLDYDEFKTIVIDLGLDLAPELYRGPWKSKEEMFPYAEGQSVLNPKVIREGFVVKPVINRYESRLDSRLIFKLIGEGYNLKK